MSQPKVCILDIERSPSLAYVWGRWGQNISNDKIVKESSTISFAYKWLGKKKVHFHSDFHDGHEDMIYRAYEVLDEADVVIGYNSERFDTKHLNTEMWLQGLGKPSPFKQIDLLKVIKRSFNFDSNKLDNVMFQKFGERKLPTDFDLWVKCMKGEKAAWDRMKRYNRSDVALTEELYLSLLPWIGTGVHLGMYNEDLKVYDSETGKITFIDSCGACGSTRLDPRRTAHTGVSVYQLYICLDCGSWSRGKNALGSANIRPAAL